jgi:hypothetical protein
LRPQSASPEVLYCLFVLTQNVDTISIKSSSFRCQLQGAGRAREQQDAQLRFQRLDGARDSRWIDQQRSSGGDKAVSVDGANKDGHRSERHGHGRQITRRIIARKAILICDDFAIIDFTIQLTESQAA